MRECDGCLLNRYAEVEVCDLLHEIFPMVDHMSRAHLLAGLNCLVARCRGDHNWKFQGFPRKLDGSTTNTTTSVDLPGIIISQCLQASLECVLTIRIPACSPSLISNLRQND